MFAVQIFPLFVEDYLDNCFGNTTVLLVVGLTVLVNEPGLSVDCTDDDFSVAVGTVVEPVEPACVAGCSADCTDIVARVVLHNQLKIRVTSFSFYCNLILLFTLIACWFFSFLLLRYAGLSFSGLISIIVKSNLFTFFFNLPAALKPIRYNILNSVVGFRHGFGVFLFFLNLVFAFYLY